MPIAARSVKISVFWVDLVDDILGKDQLENKEYGILDLRKELLVLCFVLLGFHRKGVFHITPIVLVFFNVALVILELIT